MRFKKFYSIHEDMELKDLDGDFVKSALRLKAFTLKSQDLKTTKYKKEIQFVVRTTWFPNFDLSETIKGTKFSKTAHNKLLAKLKKEDSKNAEALIHYPMSGIGPGEFMFYFMYDEASIGGGASKGIDVSLGNNGAELKSISVSKTAKGEIPKGYVSGFFMGGAEDTSKLAGKFADEFTKIGIKSGGSGKGLEYGRKKLKVLKQKNPKIFKSLEDDFKNIAASYFRTHTVIFINNDKKDATYGEILHVGPVNARDVIIDTITQSSIKPAVKI